MKPKFLLCLALVLSGGLLLLYALSFGPVIRFYGANGHTGGAFLPAWVRTVYQPLNRTPEPLAGVLNRYTEWWVNNVPDSTNTAPWKTIIDAQLLKASDLVVVGRVIATKDLKETNQLNGFNGTFCEVETIFKATDVLKGMPANDRIVLHHYRFENGFKQPPSMPKLAKLNPNTTNEYLLYLVNEGPNQYAPASGQAEALSSIRPAPDLFPMFQFRVLASIADADPSISHPISVRVPTKLKSERTPEMLSVEIDTNSFESTNLMVGTNMVTGSDNCLYVYPIDAPRPSQAKVESISGIDCLIGGVFHETDLDGIPVPGKKYVVEADLIIFETDIPPQHMWEPYGKNYKVLWRRTLTQTVE